MRSKIAVIVVLLCPFSTGCGLFSIGTRNLLYEANLIKDSRIEKIHYARLAHQAWADVRRACPESAYSSDYAYGFHCGFVDYLYAGGSGEPPAVPPKHYLRYHVHGSKGCEGVMDWYAGFRHGTAVARESGLRRLVVLSLPMPHAPPPTVVVGAPQAEPNAPVYPSALPLPWKEGKTPEVPPPTPTETPVEAPVPMAPVKLPRSQPEMSSPTTPSARPKEPPNAALEAATETSEPPTPELPLGAPPPLPIPRSIPLLSLAQPAAADAKRTTIPREASDDDDDDFLAGGLDDMEPGSANSGVRSLPPSRATTGSGPTDPTPEKRP